MFGYLIIKHRLPKEVVGAIGYVECVSRISLIRITLSPVHESRIVQS